MIFEISQKSVANKFSKLASCLGLSLSAFFLAACLAVPASQTLAPDIHFTNTADFTAAVVTPEQKTATPFEIPTELFSNDQEFSDWLFSINEGSQCRLPCWWGFDPAFTHWENVLVVFESFDVLTDSATNAPGYDIYSMSSVDTNVGELTLTSWVKDDLYSNLFVDFDPSTASLEELDYISDHYGLASILRDYGRPTAVLVGLRSAASDPGSVLLDYELWIVYEEFGLLVNYNGPYLLPELTDERIQVCIHDWEMTNIQMVLQSADIGTQITKITSFGSGESLGIDAQVADRRLIPWEEATGTSFGTFYDTAISGSESLCFSSPIGLWEN